MNDRIYQELVLVKSRNTIFHLEVALPGGSVFFELSGQKMVEPLYKDIIKEIKPENIIMMGDSAGGGLALALEEKLGEKEIEVPEKLILISPWIDTRMTNPKIEEVQEYDKDLSKEKLKLAGIAYAGEKENNSYLVNPIDRTSK